MDAGRTFARHLDRYRFACVDSRTAISRRVSSLGLAVAVPGECFPRYLRTLDQARHQRNADLRRTASQPAKLASANQRGAETTLARCVARNWCACRARRLVLAGRGFFAELLGDGARLAQATCIDFLIDWPRVQRAHGGVFR